MTPIRRVNFYAGSGAGKSTVAAYIFAELKIAGFNVEHVTEAIKQWVFEGRPKLGFDHVYLFGKQLRKEDILLRSQIDLVVTDSPVLLQTFYSDLVGHCTVPGQLQMALEFEKEYPSINIMLSREGIPFSPVGRYEKSIDEAISLDNKLMEFLERNDVQFTTLRSANRPMIRDFLIEVLGPLKTAAPAASFTGYSGDQEENGPLPTAVGAGLLDGLGRKVFEAVSVLSTGVADLANRYIKK